MRICVILLLAFLAGCQTSRDNPKNQYLGQYAPSGVFSNGDGSIGVYGKAWGEDGKRIATMVAYRRIFEFADKHGYAAFRLANEKHNHVLKGTKSLIPTATRDQDYHSVRLIARLYTANINAPYGAKSVDWLRQQYEPGFTSSFSDDLNSQDPDLLDELSGTEKPVTLIRKRKPVATAKPVKKKRVKAKAEPEVEEPLVILAPAS